MIHVYNFYNAQYTSLACLWNELIKPDRGKGNPNEQKKIHKFSIEKHVKTDPGCVAVKQQY